MLKRIIGILLLGCGGAVHGEAVAQLPLESYAGLPYVQSMALSPDGARVAIVHNIDGKSVLVVRRPEEEQLVVLLTGDNEHGNIGWVRWANSEQLLVGTRYAALRGTTLTTETRLLSIPANGGEPRSVLRDKAEDRWGRGDKGTLDPQFQDQIVDMLPDDKDYILVAWDLEELNSPGVYRVNVSNSRRKLVHRAVAGISEWLTDQQHRVRVGVARQQDQVTIHVRRADTNDYQPLWSFQVFSRETVEPLGFGVDPNVLFVRAYHEGYLAVFKVALDQPDARQLVLALPGQDANGTLLHCQLTGEAVGLVAPGGRMLMWESKHTDFMASLERVFAGDAVSVASMSRDEQRYLALTSGTGNAGTFYFGDRKAGMISPIAYRYPDLPATGMVGNKPVSYSARDGQSIAGTLTLPAGVPPTKLPAIIFHQGVPTLNARGDFDYWGEFFANRGYAVLQVNFRGSSGYGVDPLRGNIHGWGPTMPDDVVDGARWLVEQGIADAQRLCLVGGSYGGYAALMGVIQEPELFRCAVSFAGVTDLVDLVEYATRFDNHQVASTLIGDDKDQLRDYSPLALADKVNVPLLLVHGTEDRVVRVHHGRAMHRALERAEKPHRYVEQSGGNHYLSSEAQRVELFREMEAFLAEHLGSR